MCLKQSRYTLRHHRTTAGQNLQLLWQQTDFGFTPGQCLVSDENSACWIPMVMLKSPSVVRDGLVIKQIGV